MTEPVCHIWTLDHLINDSILIDEGPGLAVDCSPDSCPEVSGLESH